jgi:hypothetical protein
MKLGMENTQVLVFNIHTAQNHILYILVGSSLLNIHHNKKVSKDVDLGVISILCYVHIICIMSCFLYNFHCVDPHYHISVCSFRDETFK